MSGPSARCRLHFLFPRPHRLRGLTCRATKRSCRRWPGSRCCTSCGRSSSGRTRSPWIGMNMLFFRAVCVLVRADCVQNMFFFVFFAFLFCGVLRSASLFLFFSPSVPIPPPPPPFVDCACFFCLSTSIVKKNCPLPPIPYIRCPSVCGKLFQKVPPQHAGILLQANDRGGETATPRGHCRHAGGAGTCKAKPEHLKRRQVDAHKVDARIAILDAHTDDTSG